MHKPFLVTSLLEELWIIKMPCVMIEEQNIRLDYRMFRLPTGGRSESLHFIVCAEVDYYFYLKYFLKREK